jgi:two-component system, chemotaxis family, chemotaxis protein CheY
MTPTTRVLVVDDDEDFRRVATRLLQEGGYEVEIAREGAGGIARYRAGGVDVVLMDVYMPGTDGVEAIIRLRHEFPDARIVAVSGGGYRDSDEVLDIARRIGASRTLTKPLDKEVLLQAVAEVLGPLGHR